MHLGLSVPIRARMGSSIAGLLMPLGMVATAVEPQDAEPEWQLPLEKQKYPCVSQPIVVQRYSPEKVVLR